VDRLRDLLTIVLINLTALGVIVRQLRDPRDTAVRVEPPPSPTPMATATPVLLHVYVSGAVGRPRVVRLAEGARVSDAVDAAGGLLPGADVTAVNLAAPVADGWHLHVPAEGEAAQVGGVAPLTAGPADAMPAGGADRATASIGGQVDLNSATAAELETLPGVGPALAERILAHRASHGRFSSVEDLLAVSGIGEKTLERLRDKVTVR
jgi:competence protein ComEA